MKCHLQQQRSEIIAELNDALRQTFWGGSITMTAGVSSLDSALQAKIFNAVRDFNDFTRNNDPYGEHDCASITVEETRIIWKIDCYDKRMEYASPDAADSSVTCRVLTVMLAEEY